MSTRKLLRNQMRKEGETLNAKSSKYLHNAWERFVIKKYGAKTRKINVAKGTHKRRTWRNRIASAIND